MQNQIGEHIVRVSLIDRFRKNRTVPASDASESTANRSERRRERYVRLMEAQEAALLRFAMRLCRNHRDDAQDLVQETLVRGYEAYQAGRFAEGSNERAWLMRILMNVFLNENRRRKWSAETDLDSLIQKGIVSLEALHAAPADRPDTAILMRTLDEPLENALDTLTEDLRVCTLLVDVEELTYAEAAAVLNIPIGTVRSRLWRARNLLHAYLCASADFDTHFTKGQDRGD